MAKYKQVKRDGRWVTINTETGKEVKPGEGQLGDLARQGVRALRKFGDNLVYSDKTDSKGRPLTRAQANAGTDAEGRRPKVGDTKKDEKGRTLIYTGKVWKLKSALDSQGAINRYRTPSGQPTGSRRNWRNGHGAQSDKPSEGDKKTWPTKKTTTTSGGSSGGTTRTSGGSSSNSSSTSSTPRRKPTGQGSRGFTMNRDLGKELKISTSGKTESKPKSRLDKALSNVGKWEEPKTKRKPNKKNRDKWVNR